MRPISSLGLSNSHSAVLKRAPENPWLNRHSSNASRDTVYFSGASKTESECISPVFESLALRPYDAPIWEKFKAYLLPFGLNDEVTSEKLRDSIEQSFCDPAFADPKLITALLAVVLGHGLDQAKSKFPSYKGGDFYLAIRQESTRLQLGYRPPTDTHLKDRMAEVLQMLIAIANDPMTVDVQGGGIGCCYPTLSSR